MIVGKKVRIEPNREQEKMFFSFAGTSRFAWNECVSFEKQLIENVGEYATLKMLMKHIQCLKRNDSEFVWLNDVPEAITKRAIMDYIEASKKSRKDIKEKSYDYKNPDKYKPKFKKKFKCTPSFYQRTDNIRKTDDTHIKITGIKQPVKCTALRGIDLPEHIQNPRITFDGKYWYLSYSFEADTIDIIDPADFERDRLGIDLGVKEFAFFSDGTSFRNVNKDKTVRKLRRCIRKLQRQVSRKYEANVVIDDDGNKRFHKTNNIKKLEQQIRMIYRRIHNILLNHMYEVANCAVRTKPRKIVIETLNVKGMLQNPKLAKSIQEECFYTFRRILAYKCEWNGIELEGADMWYPSSKMCSGCGNVKHDLKLKDRVYKCDTCGLVIDRDLNAAINLERYPGTDWRKKTA